MPELTPTELISTFEILVEYFGGIPENGRVEWWDNLAVKLSRIAEKDPPWSWRYPQGVFEGSLAPSKKFIRALLALGAAIDEVPSTMILYTETRQVYVRPGTVQEGSLIMGESKPCKRAACPVIMVPSVPWRDYCSDECRKLARKEQSR